MARGKILRIALAALLVVGAVIALICNLSAQKEVLYMASIVAVVGTALILVKEIVQSKVGKS